MFSSPSLECIEAVQFAQFNAQTKTGFRKEAGSAFLGAFPVNFAGYSSQFLTIFTLSPTKIIPQSLNERQAMPYISVSRACG
jgi:hypothetical protein